MKKIALFERLAAAKTALAAAEADLERALETLTKGPRADKVAVTAVVADAFEKLREARKEIAALDRIIRVDEPIE